MIVTDAGKSSRSKNRSNASRSADVGPAVLTAIRGTGKYATRLSAGHEIVRTFSYAPKTNLVTNSQPADAPGAVPLEHLEEHATTAPKPWSEAIARMKENKN